MNEYTWITYWRCYPKLELHVRNLYLNNTNRKRRIGILTGGGDAPGLNAVIRAVVHTAMNDFNVEVLGLRNGFDGLVEPEDVLF
ncbi:MAG: hypothetical protein CM1200mP6_10750 [Anaerolineaceae bacterium]|nr:MAG: hypothetical protein CM1200mP6_10750 [Anaerolineaceae bacterium]